MSPFRYLIVRNVLALGCGDDLLPLFSSSRQVYEFAKRKLDDSVFLENRLQLSYASNFDTLSDTKDKLKGRRKEILERLNHKLKDYIVSTVDTSILYIWPADTCCKDCCNGNWIT